MKYEPKIEKIRMCPLEYGLEVFGGRWTARIICILSAKENMRYNEIKKELGNITDTVLSTALKELQKEEIITRKQYNEIPLRVEYNLSEKGKETLPILQMICEFSRKYSKEDIETLIPLCLDCDQLK